MKLDGGVIYTQIEDQLPQFIQYDHPKFVKFVEKYYEFLETNLITFTDLDLNEFKIIQESDSVTYVVSIQTGSNVYGNGGNKFYLNDDVSPTITLNTGTTYIFDMSSETFDGTHYFEFSTTPDGIHTAGGEIYVDSIRVDGTPGTGGAQTVITITPDMAGTNLYYFCNTHSGMGGNIVISNTTPFFSLENGNTDSSNTNPNYLDLENPLRQGEQFLSGEVVKGSNSGAQAVVRGKYSNNQIYVHETNNGNFQVGETIVGQTSRVSANVSSWSRQPVQASRNLIPFQDIDLAPQGFIELFRKEFLHGIPTTMLADKALVLKHIKDFYRAKGNEESYRFVFRILFGNENVNFYYPSTDVMRLSDGRWTLDKSIKLETITANNVGSFVGRVIVGQTSNVRAIVERTENYQIGATPITELFLSNIDANNAVNATSNNSQYTSFAVNETVITDTADDDGNFAQGDITGLLASVTIDAGGSNYSVGDDIIVSGGGGQEGAVKVASVSDATISSFDIIDSGDGYAVGDPVTFVNEGTGGTGGSARVQTIIPTKTILTAEQIINTFKDDEIGASAYTTPWTSYTCNTHLYSNSDTTFTASFTGTAPKKGDFIALFSGTESISSYTPSTSVFGTVIEVDGSAITYAVGSVEYDSVGTATVNNFADGDEIVVFDLTKDSNGDAINASGNNAVFYSTGSTFTLSNTPSSQTSNTYFGALTMTGTSIGAIRSIQVLSSGQGYVLIPQVSVANNIVESYGSAIEKTGANSVFLTLSSAIANQFTSNTVIKNDDNTANGVVLDFIDVPTSLVETGNTVLRVQMNTTQNFTEDERITAYVNESGGNPIGIGDFFTANISTSATTATFTVSDHGLVSGQKVVISGVSTGVTADDPIYNNTHTITAVTNTSTFTATLGSTPTTLSVTNALTRRVVTANTASSNAVFANTGIPGNNAVISISSIAIGAIQSVTIYNFGANYTSAPTLDATQSGDGNASLSAELGSLAEYAGYFNGNYGLLSTTNRMQDNYYYQDFSYVIKTDVDVASYRDTILQLVHPAGMALFGEIAITSNTAVKLFANSARDENDTVTSTTHGIQVPQYRFHQVVIANQNTASSNVAGNVVSKSVELELTTEASANTLDGRIESPSTDFNLILEHGSTDGIALEGFEDVFILEDDSSGAVKIMQEENDPSYFLSESYYDLLVQEEDGVSILSFEEDDAYRRSFVLFEPEEEFVNILSEDDYDVFRIEQEENYDLLILERSQYEYDLRVKVEETLPYAFSLPIIKFPEAETGTVKIDFGPASDLLLETGDYLLLEDSAGYEPKYLAFETTLQEEVIPQYEIDITLGPANVELETDVVLLEDGTFLLLEDSFTKLAYEKAEGISKSTVEYLYQASGRLTLTGAENYEILAENGDRFITESTITQVRLATESQSPYILEQNKEDFLMAIGGGLVDSPGAALISANYGDENEVLGENTLFETEFASLIVLEDESGVLLIENATSDDYIIVLENTEYTIYDGIVLEDGSGKIATEEIPETLTNRLIFHEYHDLVTEEENIALEEEFHVILEAAMDNIARDDFWIEEVVPTMSDEDGYDILLEDYTDNDNFKFVTEDGRFLSNEEATDSNPSHIMMDQSYIRAWSEGQITQSGTTITLTGSSFPHGVDYYGTLFYANGDYTTITSRSTDNLSIEVENSATIGSPVNYRIEYGRDESIGGTVPSIHSRKLLAELCANELNADSEFFDDGRRGYWFIPNGMVGVNTITELLNRHGNNINYEDEYRIYAEDGETTVDDNIILLEDDTKLSYEQNDTLLLEDNFDSQFLLRDGERFIVKNIANNTSMTLSSTETTHTPYTNATFFIERTERITS